MSSPLLSSTQLQDWLTEARHLSQQGALPTYIPQLAQVNPCALALGVQLQTGEMYEMGDVTLRFPLMSVIKPFVLLYVLQEVGEWAVWQRVGVNPSDAPYNSLQQLEADGGFPRNPMLNSGAIALCDLMPGDTATEQTERFCSWLNELAHGAFRLDHSVLASVRSHPNPRNLSLVEMLAQWGYLRDPVKALDTYQQVCCLAGTIGDLTQLGMMLLQSSPSLTPQHCRTVLAIMLTCGLYEASGRFAVQVGVPTKSGVSGVVLSVIPRYGAIACYSPPLNPQGNSIAGLWLVETLAKHLQASVFAP